MIDDLSALRLQLDWGADEAIGERAMDRLAPRPAALTLQPPAQRPAAAAIVSAAPKAGTLDELMAELAAFEGCALRTTAMQLVRPDGNPRAPLVVIGDAPGSDDDRSGRAFSGPGGELVNRVLGSVGFDRQSVLLTTLVPWRPPGNRRLAESELNACLPFTHRLLAIVRPRRLLLVGAQTVRALTGESGSIRRLRGRWLDVPVQNGQLTVAAMAVPTPDQWLTSPTAKQQLWADMIAVRLAVTTG